MGLQHHDVVGILQGYTTYFVHTSIYSVHLFRTPKGMRSVSISMLNLRPISHDHLHSHDEFPCLKVDSV